ncbi:RNB domain-containing ribonuclease [Methanogenium organophilum]|uniref:RNB domain-containing ribonuclease n=1 Tax=Methanogenium organophilum TaxID=2199 RepID=A0A9X9S2U6_METOG|nr:RNB domain-containing ribonuclease [Methanogenium organophilum]WAI00493.1 RNB domain-containing ribonuclease [Methanogenium organophilum]
MNRRQEIDLTAIAWDTMERFGFYPEFPRSVLREVEVIKPKIHDGEIDSHDLTSLLWSSIDNWDSMDLDQIEYCEKGAAGEIHVKVAIADVDSYVPKRSQADRYAAHNGTSVYTGIVTFPMLPDHLSKGITSLLPGQDCEAVVIEYTVLPDGNTRHGSLYRATVANKAKLIYEEVGEWLEGTRDIPVTVSDVPALEEQILMQHEAAQRLRRYRMKHGALDLQTIEAEPVMEEGRVKDLVVQRQDLARQVIEEFMVAANGTTVAYLEDAGLPMIERVVVTPKYWDEIVDTAAEYGWKLPSRPDAKSLSRFLDYERERDPDTFPDLSLTIVKLMGPGEYIARDPKREPVGHFALAVTDYTHSTAPNRRYADLIIQRLVKSAIEGDHCPYTYEDLEEESAWLSDREKRSKKVERFMRKAAAAVLLEDRIGEKFEGFVTGASERGTYVRLIEPPVEGRVMRGEGCLKVGHKVIVRLIHTDPERGYVDFECTGKRPGIRRFS